MAGGHLLVRSREQAVRKGEKGTRRAGLSQTDSKKSALDTDPVFTLIRAAFP